LALASLDIAESKLLESLRGAENAIVLPVSTGLCFVVCLFTGSIAPGAKRRYLCYSEGDLEVLCPAEATCCTVGVKLGTGTESFPECHPSVQR